jgi:exodeoxyribonuclease VII small subunit
VTEPEQGKSPDNPWPVRAVATRVAKYIDRLGTVWIEGQLTELKVRQSTAWMVLRDPAADMSLTVSCPRDLVTNAPVPLSEGTQVIMHGKPQFYTRNGSFSLRISEIRAVGLGELLARIERLRRLLDAEGLFDPRLKRPIPFLPRTIGLITGRASHAERDVISVATDRWPAVHFAVRNTAVQGTSTVPQVVEALRELDADPNVDVIVIARGGGSVEDLLPFSDETLCREIAKCTTVRPCRRPSRGHAHRCGEADRARRRGRAGARHGSATAVRTRPAQLGAPRAAHPLATAKPAGAGTAIGRAQRSSRRDPSVPRGRPPRHHPIGGGRIRPDRPLVGPAHRTGTGGHVGPWLCGRADGGGRDLAYDGRRACGHTVAGTGRRRGRHRRKRGQRMKTISELGYEEARDELIDVVRQLEQGGLDLEASLKLWERGEELAKCCEEQLAGARKRVEDALASKDQEDS